MHAARSRAVVLVLAIVAGAAHAGQHCDARPLSADAFARAAASALRAETMLDERDEPVALIARVGTDLSKHGLRFSHGAFVVRDHPDGRWTVVHQLNTCGTTQSRLFAQGLVNFFADDLVTQEFRITWLSPALHAPLVDTLVQSPRALHEPRYNVIARFDSARYQNSTAWLLEHLVAADCGAGCDTRDAIHGRYASLRFTPDVIRIPYTKRVVGGLFSANAVFTDHPLGARLGGEYRVVTMRAIHRLLREASWSTGAVAVDRDGARVAVRGDD